MRKILATLLTLCLLFCPIACDDVATTASESVTTTEYETFTFARDDTEYGDNNEYIETVTEDTIAYTETVTEATTYVESVSTIESTTELTTKITETIATTKAITTTIAQTEPPHVHSFSPATCTSPAKCSCGVTKGSASAHNYINGICDDCGTKNPYYTSQAMVWIPTNGGTKYHTHSGCSNMKDPIQVTKSEAVNQGFDACKRCH